MGALEGKVAVVTGGGRGIGRGEALLLAAEGAAVVVNDLGVAWDGSESSERPAESVVQEITAAGGRAVANYANVATEEGAEDLVAQAIEEFGDLHVVVNNAGVLGDGMLFSIEPSLWRSVVDVHVLGHFFPTRVAAQYWRQRAKEVGGGDDTHRAVICTSSESGLFGNAGQTNYDVAKMGLVSFAMAASRELAKYGVTVNTIAPRARTRLTTTTFEGTSRSGEFGEVGAGFDPMDPENIAPFVAFLATDAAREITAQTFIVYGGAVARVRMAHVESTIVKHGDRWTVDELAAESKKLFEELPPDHLEGPKGYARLPRQDVASGARR